MHSMSTPTEPTSSPESALLPPRPVIIAVACYLLGMAFFSLLRLLFFQHFYELAAGETTGDILTAFLIGLRFDQIIVLAAMLPVILPALLIRLEHNWFRKYALGYLATVFSLAFLLLLADIRFYAYFDSHLNFLAVEYLGEGPMMTDLIAGDSEFFPMLLAWMILTSLFAMFLALIFSRARKAPHYRSLLNHMIYTLVLAAFVALGIRGRISLAPMDWGVAYFSQNRFMNQLALNGIYTLGRNLTENERDPRLVYLSDEERFGLVALDQALETTREMLTVPGEVWHEPDKSLLRTVRQPPAGFGFSPNIVIILSESWSAELTGALGSLRQITPNFDRIAGQGLLFENFYASGSRTNFGISAVFCSFPALPGRAIMKRYNAHHPFISLSEILEERGYHNAFVYGGDLAFDNMEGFLRQKKFHTFYGEVELGKDLYFSKWGIPDHLLFERSAGIIDSLPRPFQLTILTLSNHEPWDLPDSTVRRYFDDADSSKIFNSQIYADHSLGRFFDLVRDKAVFDSTIFVFVSDHARYGPSRFILDTRLFHVPLLIYAPGLAGNWKGVNHVFGSQTDILPTLMGLLGDDYTHASWGRDLFNLPAGDSGFAIMNVAGRIGYIDADYLYVEDLGGLTGFGTVTPAGNNHAWFGAATLELLDVVGRDFAHENWMRVYSATLDPVTRFADMYALNRMGTMGRGHLLVQTLNPGASTAAGEPEPPGLKWSRDRLHRYMQTADQLSTPQ